MINDIHPFEHIANAGARAIAEITTRRLTAGRRLFLDSSECALLDQRAIDYLVNAGVKPLDFATPSPSIAGCRVVFDPLGRYAPNPIGEFAYIIPAFAGGEVVDAVAWCPRTNQIGSRLGRAYLLGADELRREGAGTTGTAIQVRRSPLEWLRAGRKGIVIVDDRKAALALSGRFLRAEDDAHVRELRRRMKVRSPIVLGPGQIAQMAA